MDRAYAVITEKQVDDGGEFVTIRGIASTPTTDRMGDIVEPMGAKFALPMKLLLQHDHGAPVGNVTFAEPTPKGIPFEARLPRVTEAGRLKDRVDEAIHSLKYDLISAVSIGFRAVADQVERLKEGGLRFKEWEWIELSLVTIPANSEAVITAVKSVDHATLRAIDPDGPKFEMGDEVESLVDHMEGMKGSVGAISIIKNGPYYGVTFPGDEKPHKWLAESEIKPADPNKPKPTKPMKPMKPMGSMKSNGHEHLPASGHGVSQAARNPGASGTQKAAPRGAVQLIPRKSK